MPSSQRIPHSPVKFRKRKTGLIVSPTSRASQQGRWIPRWWAWVFFGVLLIQTLFIFSLLQTGGSSGSSAISRGQRDPWKLENFVIINEVQKDQAGAKTTSVLRRSKDQREVKINKEPVSEPMNSTTENHVNYKNVSPHEINEAFDYVKSIRSFQRKINFFHIPKTAGTAIEHVAAEMKDLAWGSCAFNHKPKRDVCRHLYPGELWPSKIGWWHVPTHLFPAGKIDPYQKSELFAVVRDPYDRMVSEYFYVCTLTVKDWRPAQCDREKLFDKDYMNHWLQEKLTSNKEKHDAASFIKDNGHFTQQYDFVIAPNQVRMVDHVLYLGKTLNADFNNLMQKYGLDIKLQEINSIGSEARNTTDHLTVDDLSVETINLIHELYPHDFGMFRYNMRKSAENTAQTVQ